MLQLEIVQKKTIKIRPKKKKRTKNVGGDDLGEENDL